jgi:hypothetical protein
MAEAPAGLEVLALAYLGYHCSVYAMEFAKKFVSILIASFG